jgi:hypothetical protein
MTSENSFGSIIISCLVTGMFLTSSALRGPALPQTQVLENTKIRATVSSEGITSLVDPGDIFKADIINSRVPWGRVKLVYRSGGGEWKEMQGSDKNISAMNSSVVLTSGDAGTPVTVKQSFSLNSKGLDYDIIVNDNGTSPVEIGDLAVYLPWRTASGENAEYIFEKCFTKHHYISGNGSFIFFTKPSGEPPFIMVLPKKGTKLEYFDGGKGGYKAYIHSAVAGNSVASGTWRQEHTSLKLNPDAGQHSVNYGFKILWANSWDDIRQTLYEEGLFDIRVVPGMTVPTDLTAQFSLHTKNVIDSIISEFPGKTSLKYLGEKQPGHFIYEVSFRKLGENMLTVYYGEGQKIFWPSP